MFILYLDMAGIAFAMTVQVVWLESEGGMSRVYSGSV
jgi:hypothetical protein